MSKSSEQTHIAINDIVGLAEIAERLEATSRQVWNWTRRYTFPKPLVRVSNTPIWDWNDVQEWHKSWVPSKGGWHTHKAQREAATKPKRSRKQFMEGDDDGTKPTKTRKSA